MNRPQSAREREIERAMGNSSERVIMVIAILLTVAAVLMAAAHIFFLWAFQPPEVDHPVVHVPVETEAPSPEPEQVVEEPLVQLEPVIEEGWRQGVYTILLAGEDRGRLTDVIMVALFDTRAGTLDVLSIPRDTMANLPWHPPRINSIPNMYRRLEQDYDHYIYALRDGVANLMGYRANNWVNINLQGFVNLVDAIGGVEFYVPQRMVYRDPVQNLFINLQPGLQILNGEQAMHLVRFRSYAEGDIQRNRTQQAFLGALASQLLQARNLWVIDDLVQIFQDNVSTDLSFTNLGFFAREFLQLERENIRFHVVDRDIANIADSVRGASLVTLYIEPWLELINSYMNPFTREITTDHVEIRTRDPQSRNFITTEGRFYGREH